MFMRNILIAFLNIAFVSLLFAEETPYQIEAQPSLHDYELDVEAVYNKKFKHKKRHELSAGGGLYFRNDLNSTISTGGNYTYHFSEYHSWEILNFIFLSNRETQLRKEIKDKTGLVPDTEDNQFFLTTAYSLHPTYGKIAWFGSKILHFDLYFLIGGGVRKLAGKNLVKPAATGGAGFRFYLSQRLSLRLDARDLLFSEKQQSGNKWIHAFVPTVGLSVLL